MKRLVSLLALTVAILSAECRASLLNKEESALDMKTDLSKNEKFADSLIADVSNLPISFEYGGKKFHGIPKAWNPAVKHDKRGKNIHRTTITGRDPETGLSITFELERYTDFPVCEWIAWLENTSQKDTPVFANIRAADMTLLSGPGDPVLWNGIGECHTASNMNYSFKNDTLTIGREMSFAPTTGYSCNHAFPYFRISGESGGRTVAIGWPGQWSAKFKNAVGRATLVAGQQTTDFYLKPGEKVRTPRITLLSYGKGMDAANLWRHWYRAYMLPKDTDGVTPLQPRFAGIGRRKGGVEHCNEDEASQLGQIALFQEHGFPVKNWWIDAGWYSPPGGGWWRTGVWAPAPDRFPRGLRPISDALAKSGARLLLWFEPERISQELPAMKEHPEWQLAWSKSKDSWLMNFADPDCVDYISKKISRVIKDNGVGVYRQDSNFGRGSGILPYWEENDAKQGKNRRGITENLYIQGHLRFWRFLLADNPGIWLDSCAGGGRRNDLETMRGAAVPLHYSDYGYTFYIEKQRFHHMLYQWLMIFKSGLHLKNDASGRMVVDEFLSIVDLSPYYHFNFALPENCDIEGIRKFVQEFTSLIPYMVDGDYHLLSDEQDLSRDDRWTVRQFHRSDLDSGFFQVIRNEKDAKPSFAIVPKGISPEKDYLVRDWKDSAEKTVPGRELLENGYIVPLEKASATLVHYRKKY